VPTFSGLSRSVNIASEDDLAQPSNRPAVDRLEPVAINPESDRRACVPKQIFDCLGEFGRPAPTLALGDEDVAVAGATENVGSALIVKGLARVAGSSERTFSCTRKCVRGAAFVISVFLPSCWSTVMLTGSDSRDHLQDGAKASAKASY